MESITPNLRKLHREGKIAKVETTAGSHRRYTLGDVWEIRQRLETTAKKSGSYVPGRRNGDEGLRASIQRNGQRVPILVRPIEGDRYGLIYGRRRLEACRELSIKVRAIVTEVEGDQALRDQLLENQERRDLSFIERALVATAQLDGDHLSDSEKTNRGVAEVLNLTEAGVSQLLNVVRVVGEDVIFAIGAAPGAGRPRWEELKKLLASNEVGKARLVRLADRVRSEETAGPDARSDNAFLAVLAAAKDAAAPAARLPQPDQVLKIAGVSRKRKAIHGPRKFCLRDENHGVHTHPWS